MRPKLKLRGSLILSTALASAVVPHQAKAQFAASGSATGATVSGGAITVQSSNATINWTPFDSNSGASPIDFLPTTSTVTYTGVSGLSNYTVINRVLPFGGATGRAIAFNGQVTSRVLNAAGAPVTGGTLVFYTPGGIVVANGASFTIGSLVLTTADPTVLGADSYRLNSTAGSQNGVTIQNGATINALNANSYVALVAPRVTQGGRVNVNGTAAYVAAEGVDITFQPNALYNVTISAGSDAGSNPQTFSHTGVTQLGLASGVVQQQRVLMAAVAKNEAITMLVGGDVRYANATGASLSGDSVVLTAGRPQGQATGSNVTLASGALGTTVSATAQSTLTLQANRIDPSVFGEATGTAQLLTTAQPNQTLTYGQDVTLFGLRNVLVSDVSGASQTTLAITGNLFLNAPAAATETGTISITNGAGLTAQNIYLDVSGFGSGPNVDAVGGVAAVRVTGVDSVISTPGVIEVRANAFGAVNAGGAQGGSAAVIVDGGTIQAGTGLTVSAIGTGYSTSVPAVGGTATIQAVNAGSISVTAGTITAAASATADGSGSQEPPGLDNRGGTASITADSAGSISAAGLSVDATFQGQGTQARSGRGGLATLTATALDSAIRARGSAGIVVDASAYGGGIGSASGSGGSGQGGTAILSAIDGAVVASTAGTGTTIRVSADGVGGASGEGGTGGSGTGGLARLRADNQTDTGSSIDATDSFVAVSAAGSGGRGFSGDVGGSGGSGAGGTAQIQIGGLSVLSSGGAGVAAGGFGGSGGSDLLTPAGGSGGAGTGNRAEITLTQSGQYVVTGRSFITVDATGRGGDGGNGLTGTLGEGGGTGGGGGTGTGGGGGTGTGGVAQITLGNSASIVADATTNNDVSFGISAGASGGRGGSGSTTSTSFGVGGAGGPAVAGSAALSADGSSSIRQGGNRFGFLIAADSTGGPGGGDFQSANSSGAGVQGGAGGAALPGTASVSLQGAAAFTVANLSLTSIALGGSGGDGSVRQNAGSGGAGSGGTASLTLAGTSSLDAESISAVVTGSGGNGGVAADGTTGTPGTGGAGGDGTGGTVTVRQDAGTAILLSGVPFSEGPTSEFVVNASGIGGGGGNGGSPTEGSGSDGGAGGAGQGGSIALSLAGSYSPATNSTSRGQLLLANGSGGDAGIGGTLPFSQGTVDQGGNGGLGGVGRGGSVRITFGSGFSAPSAAPNIRVSTTGAGGGGGDGGSAVDPTDPGFVAGVNAGDAYNFGQGGRAGDVTGGSVALATGGALTLGALDLGATVVPGQAGVGYNSGTANGVPVLQAAFGCCASQSFGRGVALDLTGTLTADATVVTSFGPAVISSKNTGAFTGTDVLTITATGQTDILVPVNLQAGLSLSATGPSAPNYNSVLTGDINVAASITASSAFLLTFDGSIDLTAPLTARSGGISFQSAAIAITGSGAATATQGNIDIGPFRNAVFGGAGGSGSPYELTQAGFDRLKAQAINVQNLNTLSFTVQDLTIQGTGFGSTTGNIVSTGQSNAPAIAFSTPGDLRVEGQVRIANAGPNDLISFISGGRLQLVLPTGGVSVFDSSGQVTGRAFLYASDRIAAVTDSQLAGLLAAPDAASRTAILSQFTGAGTSYLSAGRVSIREGNAYWGADTGDANTRSGILVGPGNGNASAGLDFHQGVIAPANLASVNGLDPDQQFSQYANQTNPAEIIGYGRSTILTNNDFLGGANPGISFIQTEVTSGSSFNNCNLLNGCQAPPPPPPPPSVTPAFQGSFELGAGNLSIDRTVDRLDVVNVLANGTHVINWSPFDSGGGPSIDFLPVGSTGQFVGAGGVTSFTVINRVLPSISSTPIALNGTITSTINGQPGGNVFFYAPGGVIIGANAVVNVGGLVLTSGDPVLQTGNTYRFDSTNSAALVQVQAGAQITAQQSVQLIAPVVQQAGSVNVGGSAIYVAAQQTDVTLDDSAGTVNVGLGGSLALAPNTTALSHTGSTNSLSGAGAQAVFVAAPSNSAINLQLGGTLGSFVQGVSGAGVGFSSGNTTISFRPGAGFTGATLGDTTVSFSQTGAPLQLTSGNTTFTPASGGSTYGGRVAASGFNSLTIATRSTDGLTFQNGLIVGSGSSVDTGKPTLVNGDGQLNVTGQMQLFVSGPLTVSAPIVADSFSANTQGATIGAAITAASANIGATGASGSISITAAPGSSTALTLTADQAITSAIPLTLASLNATAGTQINLDALTVASFVSLNAPRITLSGNGVDTGIFSATGNNTGQFSFGRVSVTDDFTVSGATQLLLRAPLSARTITVSSPTAAMQLDVSSPQPGTGNFTFGDVSSLEQAANIRGGANSSIGNLRSDAGATVSTGGGLTISSISSGTSVVSLSSGGPLEVTGAVAAGDFTATARSTTAPAGATVKLDGVLSITNLNVGADSALTVSRPLTLPGFVSVNARSITFASIAAGGDVTAIADVNSGALQVTGGLSGANLFLRGDAVTVGGAAVATGYLDEGANTAASFGSINAASSVSIGATVGTLTVSGATQGTRIFVGGQSAQLGALTATDSAGPGITVNLGGGGTAVFNGAISAPSLDVTAAGAGSGITINAGLTVPGTAQFGTNGSITSTVNLSTTGGLSFSTTPLGGDPRDVNLRAVNAPGGLIIQAGGAITASGAITGGGIFAENGGSQTYQGGINVGTGGVSLFGGSQSSTLAITGATSAGRFIASRDGTVLTGDITTVGGSGLTNEIIVGSGSGPVTTGALNGGRVDLSARGTGNALTTGAVTVSNDANFASDDGIQLGNVRAGTISVTRGGTLTAGALNASTAAISVLGGIGTQAITLSSGGSLTAGGAVTGTTVSAGSGGFTVTTAAAPAGVGTISYSSIDAGTTGDVSLTANGVLTLPQAAARNLTISSTGALTLPSLTITGAIRISGGQTAITLGQAGQTLSTGSLSVTGAGGLVDVLGPLTTSDAAGVSIANSAGGIRLDGSTQTNALSLTAGGTGGVTTTEVRVSTGTTISAGGAAAMGQIQTGTLTVSQSAGFSASRIAATGATQITAAGPVAVSGSFTGGSATITTTGANGTVGLSGGAALMSALTVNASSNVTFGAPVTSSATVQLTVAGRVTGSSLTSQGGSGITIDTTSAAAGGGGIQFTSLNSSSASTTLRANGTIGVTSISAGNLTVANNGTLTLPTLSVPGAIQISGGQTAVTLGQAGQTLTAGALSVTGASGAIQLLGGLSLLGGNGLQADLTLGTSSGGISIAGATSAGVVTLTSSGSSAVSLGDLSSSRAQIDAGSGTVSAGAVTGGFSVSRSGGISVASIDGRSSGMALNAAGPIAVAGLFNLAGGSVTATGPTGSITIGGALTTTNALTLSAAQNLSTGALSAGAFSVGATAGGTASFAALSGGALNVRSGGLLTVSGAVNASTSATLGSTGAGVTLGNGLNVATTGAARLSAAGPIDVTGTTSAGALFLTTTGANGTARLRGPVQLGSVTGLPGNFSVSTSGLLTLDSTLTANALSGPGGFAQTGGASFGGQVTLANGLALQSAGAVGFNGRVQVNAGGLSVTTGAGAISFAQPVGVTGAVALNSATGLTIGGGLTIIPGSGVTLAAAGPIDVTGQLIADSIGVTTTGATGTVQLRSGANTGGALTIDASSDITAGGTLTAQSTTITGAGTGTFAALNPQGPLSIRMAGLLQVNGSVGFLTGGRFAVTLRSTGAGVTLGSNLFASDAVLGAAGPISVAGQLQAATLALTGSGANGSAQFNGPVTLSGALTANLSGALGFAQTLSAASIGGPSSGSAQALSATFSGATNITNALALTTTGGGISFGTASQSGTTLSAGSLALTAGGAGGGIRFNTAVTVGGAATLRATGAISSGATVGAASIDAQGDSIDLQAVAAPTGLVSLTATSEATVRGGLSAQSLTITTTGANAPIALNGSSVSIPGTLTLNATGAVSLLGNEVAGALAISSGAGVTGGSLVIDNGVSVTAAGPVSFSGDIRAATLALSTSGANGGAQFGGSVQLTGALTAGVSGALGFGQGLTAALLGGLTSGPAQALSATFTGPVSVTNALALSTTGGGIAFGGTLGAGSLVLTAAGGTSGIGFTGAATVAGAAALTAPGAVTAGAAFSAGSLTVTAGSASFAAISAPTGLVSFTTANEAQLGGPLAARSLAITTTAAGAAITLAQPVSLTGDLTLNAGGALTAGDLSAGGAASLLARGQIATGAVGAQTLSAITQGGLTTGALTVTGGATLDAAGPIDTGAIRAGALALIASGPNGGVRVRGAAQVDGRVALTSSGAARFDGALSAGSFERQTGPSTAAGATFSGPVDVAGDFALASGGAVAFGGAARFGTLALTTTAGAVSLAQGFTATGAAAVTSAGDLTAGGGLSAGSLTLTSGGVGTFTTLAADGAVSAQAAAALTISGATSGSQLTLQGASVGVGALTATDPAGSGIVVRATNGAALLNGAVAGPSLLVSSLGTGSLITLSGGLTVPGAAVFDTNGTIASTVDLSLDGSLSLTARGTPSGLSAAIALRSARAGGGLTARAPNGPFSAAGALSGGAVDVQGGGIRISGAIDVGTNGVSLTGVGAGPAAVQVDGPTRAGRFAATALSSGISVGGVTTTGGAGVVDEIVLSAVPGGIIAGSLSGGRLALTSGTMSTGALNAGAGGVQVQFVGPSSVPNGFGAITSQGAVAISGPLVTSLTVRSISAPSFSYTVDPSTSAPGALTIGALSVTGAAAISGPASLTLGQAGQTLGVGSLSAVGVGQALSVLGGVTASAGGITLASTGGPVSVGGAIGATGPVALSSGSSITVAGPTSGNGFSASSRGDLRLAGVDGGTGLVSLTTAGSAPILNTGGAVAGGRVVINSSGPAIAGDITARGAPGLANEIVVTVGFTGLTAGTLSADRVSLSTEALTLAGISAGAGGAQIALNPPVGYTSTIGGLTSAGAVTLGGAASGSLSIASISAPSLDASFTPRIGGSFALTVPALAVPGAVSISGTNGLTLGQAGQTLTVGSLIATNVTGPITLLGNLSASGDVTLGTLGTAGISAGAIGGGNLALTAAGVLSTRDLSGTSLTASAGGNASLGALGITNGAVVNAVGQLTLGQVTAGSLRASGSQLRIAGGQITRNAALTATGLVAVSGPLAARSIAITGGDFQLGATATLGGTNTSTITLTSTNSNGTAAGGTATTGVFSVDQGEFSRMVAQTITLNAPGDLTVGALSLRGALSANPNLTASTLELTSQGDLRVTDAVAITQAAPGDIIRLSAGRNLQVVTPTGSVSITAPDGSLTGTAQLYAGTSSNRVLGQVLVGSDQLSTDLAQLATATADARRARIAINDGPVNTAGYVQAGAIELLSTGQIYVQNSGSRTGPFAGLTTGTGGLSVGVRPLGSTAPVEVIGYGRSVVNGVTTTGFEFARTVQYFPAALSDPSFINNCNLLAPTCGGAFQGSPQVAQGSADFQRSATLDNVTLNTSAPTVLNWTPYDSTGSGPIDFLPAGSIGRFLGAPGLTGFTVINRVLPSDPTRAIALNGTIQSQLQTTQGATSTGGTVVFYAPGGVIIGSTAQVSVGSLLLTGADVSTTDGRTFSLAAQAGSQSLVQIQSGAQVSALNEGSFVALFGPRVAQAGAIQVAGTAAFVSAEAGTLTFNPDATYAVNITRGAVTPGDFSQLLRPDGSLSFFYSVDLGGSITGPGASAGSGRSLVAVVAPNSGSAASRLNASVGFGTPQTGARSSEILLASGVSATGVSGGATVPSTSAALGSVAFRGGSYGPNVRAAASGIVDFLAGGPNASGETASALRFDGSVTAGGGAGVYLDASGQTIQIAGDLTVAAPAGAQLIQSNFEADAENGGTLSIGGNLSVASAAIPGSAGVAAGGRAAMIATGGSQISVGGNLSLSADGSGGGLQAPGQPPQPGGGGFAVINAVAGSQFTVGGDLTVSARGVGVDPNAPGAIRGGTSAVIVDGSDSRFSARSATLVSTASASAGQTASGGQTNLRASNGGTLAIAGALSLDASARGATGGAAPGGVINLNSDGTGFTVGGALSGQGGSLAGTRTGTLAANSIALTLDQGANEAAALSATNGITLTAGAPVTLAALNAGGAANVSTTGALSIGPVTADSLALTAGGAAGALTLNGPVQVANAASLSAGSSLTASSAVTAGSLNVTAANAATFSAPVTVTGMFGLNVGGAASFAQALNAGSIGALTRAAQVGSASFGGPVRVIGAANLAANAGALIFANTLDTGALTLSSAGTGAGLSFAQAVSATGPVALTAAGPVAFSGGFTAPSATVTTTTAGGTVSFGPGATITNALGVTASADVSSTGALSAGSLALSTAGNASFAALTLGAPSTLSVSQQLALTGTLRSSDVTATIGTARFADVLSTGAFSVSGGSTTFGGLLQAASLNLNVAAVQFGGAVTIGGSAGITSGGGVGATNPFSADTLTLTTPGAIQFASLSISGATLNSGTSVTITGPARVTNLLSATATGPISFGGTVDAGALTTNATGANGSVAFAGPVTVQGAAQLSAAQGLTAGAVSAGSISATAGGAVQLGALSGQAVSVGAGSTSTIASIQSPGAVTLSAGGALQTGALTAGQLGVNAGSANLNGPVSVSGDAALAALGPIVIGNQFSSGSLAVLTTGTSGQVTLGGPVAVSGDAAIDARGLVRINSRFSAATISVDSADLAIGATASVGGVNTTRATFLTSASKASAMTVGGAPGAQGYQIDANELTRIRAGMIVLDPNQPPTGGGKGGSGFGSGPVTVTANPRGAPVDITVDSFTIQGSAAQNPNLNAGSAPTLVITTGSNIRVIGQASIVNAGGSDSLAMIAGGEIRFQLGSYSSSSNGTTTTGGTTSQAPTKIGGASVTGPGGGLAGQIYLLGTRLLAGYTETLAAIDGGASGADLRRALATNYGTIRPEGFLQADRIELRPATAALFQNVGGEGVYAGLTVGAGGLGIRQGARAAASTADYGSIASVEQALRQSGEANVIAFGRQSTASGFVINGDFVPPVRRVAAEVTDSSEVNGCNLRGGTCLSPIADGDPISVAQMVSEMVMRPATDSVEHEDKKKKTKSDPTPADHTVRHDGDQTPPPIAPSLRTDLVDPGAIQITGSVATPAGGVGNDPIWAPLPGGSFTDEGGGSSESNRPSGGAGSISGAIGSERNAGTPTVDAGTLSGGETGAGGSSSSNRNTGGPGSISGSIGSERNAGTGTVNPGTMSGGETQSSGSAKPNSGAAGSTGAIGSERNAGTGTTNPGTMSGGETQGTSGTKSNTVGTGSTGSIGSERNSGNAPANPGTMSGGETQTTGGTRPNGSTGGSTGSVGSERSGADTPQPQTGSPKL
jgi:filamentous hemagglutinin family protein